MVDTNLESLAKAWVQAFRNHNIDNLLNLYHDNARHYSPRIEQENPDSRGWLIGKEQLRKWWQGSFDAHPLLSYDLADLTHGTSMQGHSKMLMEYIRKVPGQLDLHVMEYFKVLDGLIVESRMLRSWVLS